jgi:hypothetical protein
VPPIREIPVMWLLVPIVAVGVFAASTRIAAGELERKTLP